MQQIVSITSQGQITIPAVFRRLLGLDQYRKALVRAENKRIVVEPIPDLMSLAGSLQNKAMKKNIATIMKMEKEATSKLVAKKYISKIK